MFLLLVEGLGLDRCHVGSDSCHVVAKWDEECGVDVQTVVMVTHNRKHSDTRFGLWLSPMLHLAQKLLKCLKFLKIQF